MKIELIIKHLLYFYFKLYFHKMADEINKIAFDAIMKQENELKAIKKKAMGEYKEAVVVTYQQNPFDIEKLKKEIKLNPNMKNKKLYDYNYNGTLIIGYSDDKTHNTIHNSILYGANIDMDDRTKMKQEGCKIVSTFFEKANQDTKWKFKTHNKCNTDSPKYWISW